MLLKAETSKAEMDPPLFSDILLHQTVEEEDEQSWNIKQSEVKSELWRRSRLDLGGSRAKCVWTSESIFPDEK